ncbi:MAG: autotransporter-associated beta strand repeat-containing protein [Akkermansia sp.]|nr:autotransporter-associated beta strand repeat-containing protein [Akkermansia sp.]
MPYFLAALGAGSALADEELLRYWWVLPDAPAEKTPRVIRVLGEKGERYEEVYAAETRAELKSQPAILRARLARQAALRKDAMELARQLRESGKSPLVAYEEAWTRVFAENRLSAAGLTLSSWLEEALARMAGGQKLTEEEQQRILEALLADEDSLEGETGQELLRRLADYLLSQGYGIFDIPNVNDELMQRFAEAMRHMGNGVAAYRDALFKTHRDRIMFHSLTGYQAPWGAGMGRGLYYRQKPKQVGTTVSSGNTQLLLSPGENPTFTAPGLNDLPGSVTDFLATAPTTRGEKTEEENDEEKEDEYQEQEEQVTSSLPPLLSTFSLRSVNPVPVVVTEDETPGDGGSGREGVLRWDSTAGEPAVWDTEQATAWVDGNGAETPYTAGGSVEFGNGEDLNKSVQVADAGVVAGAVAITGSGYHFSGGNIKVTESLSVTGAAGFDSTLDVGANRIQGGTLENVQMQITGEISRPVTGDTVTVHNLITSADGTHAAVLTDVALYAGTASEYATLHNIAFDGTSKLMGYVTFEKIQAPGKISVVDGGELTLENLTFDLRGLAMGTKTLIAGGNADTLKNWDAEHVQFVYSGVQVNSAAVDLTQGEGVLVLSFDHEGNLYWTGATDKMWDTSSANWSSSATSGATSEAFSALSNVYFGDGGNAANRVITVTQDMVVAKLGVTAGGYSFSGARVAVLGDATLNPGAGAVTFNGQLVVQGNLTTGGDGSVSLLGATHIVGSATFSSLTTTIAGDMIVDGKLNVTSGNLKISGNVEAEEMEFVVNSDAASVEVSGNLTVGTEDDDVGKITIGGAAKQQFTGTVTAKDLTVKGGDVYFSRLQVDYLTVGKDATVHVQTSSNSGAVSSSVFPEIDLSGTLALDAPGGATYNHKYDVHVQDDAARLVFGTGSTIEDLQIVGMVDNSGSSAYTDLLIEAMSRSATVTSMKDLGTLTVNTGSLTVQNAQGAVHGDLILDKGKLKLGAGSDNIMASDSGAVYLQYGSSLDIGSTTQTLYARNEAESLSLSGASSITGGAEGSGLVLGNGVCVNYADAGNSIEAGMSVAQDATVSLESTQAGSSLEIAGLISGSGTLDLTGPGSVVISGANAGFTGKVIVEQGATLTLQNTDSLSSASVVLNPGGTLNLDAPGVVNLKALTLQSGSTLAISSIVGTNDASSADAVLNIKDGSLKLDNVVLNLNFSQELKTMTTYNLMTGVTDIGKLSFNVIHNGVALDDSQYKIRHDAATDLLYLDTMMGNVWDGDSGSETGYWSKTNTDNNWTTGNGNEYGNYNEDGEYKAAIFGDLNAETSNVCLSGNVEPGDIYFTAESTVYTLSDEAGGSLAAGTHIHKLDEADVTLALGNNATLGAALGNVDIQEGNLILSKALAVNGSVTVDAGAKLEVKPGTDGLILANYKASSNDANESATLIGVTMDAAGIRGSYVKEFNAENLLVQGTAHLSDLNLNNFTAKDDVTLSNVTLSSSGLLKDVTIGQGVTVLESSSYTLSGNIVFEDTLINKGTVTLKDITSVEIGKITPTAGAAAGEYTYRLIAYDKEDVNSITNVELGEGQTFTKDSVYINGVSLGDALQGTFFTDFKYAGNGYFTLSIPDGSVGIPQWDERWGKTEKAPSFSRIYAETIIKPSDSETDKRYAHFGMAAGKGAEENYYHYESIVEWNTALKVNYGNAIVVTLSSDAKGDLAVGGRVMEDYVTGAVNWGAWAHNVEVWVDDHSKIRSIVGGLDNGMYNNVWGLDTSAYQAAATHVLVDAKYDEDKSSLDVGDWRTWDKTYIIAGSRWCNQYAESFVTVKSGEIYNVFGASCGGHYSGACYEYEDPDHEDPDHDKCLITPDCYEKDWYNWLAGGTQTGTSHVFIDGGRIGEIFAAGNFCTLNVGKGNRAVEMVITGGTIGGHQLRVFGGGNRGEITGDIYVRMEGNAQIKSRLVGGSNVGTVNGNIVLDLISGEAFRVDAAGLGWEYENGIIESATMDGEVLVNLYRAFELGIGEELDLRSGIYGGKETTNYVNLDGKVQCTSTLHFAESGKYELGYQDSDGRATTKSHYVTGFDVFSLEDKAHAVLALEYFDINMQPEDPDDKRNPDTLIIQGKGVVEVIGRGANFERDIELRTANPDETDASLQKGATLWISTCDIGTVGNGDVRTITATDGTTVDFTGFSITGLDPATPGKAGLDFNVKICGNGVDGKGALYMGESTQTAKDTNSEVNEIFLPRVELTDSASVKVVAQEALYMDSIKLAGHTFTKLGAGDFITRTLEEETEADVPPGTILVQQGSFGFAQGDTAAETDVVLADGAELKLNATGLDASDLTLRSLSGAGMVNLNGSTLTLKTVEGSAYSEKYMDEKQSYDQFTGSTGYGYAVFSGLINDGKGIGSLVKDGSGVLYISGSSNSYTGGTLLKAGRLYLLGTSEQSTSSDDTVAVASGVVGTGIIKWDGTGTELYLGHGTHIYNNGTASGQGAVMTIGVEGALMGSLKAFVGVHSRPENESGEIKYVTMGGEDYVEIDTHNLKSIAVDAMYADGTTYEANADIDRNKMLLVKESDWATAKDKPVTCLSASSYNEATYSGVLSGAAGLHKVGLGTLDLDQTNTYTGKTEVAEGSLRLRGWGTVGSDVVQVKAASSLMLAYTGSYDDEISSLPETSSLANNINLSGTGDAQWTTHDSTSCQTAALISAVGQEVTFTLSGNIEGDGGVLHSGKGTLVLNGDSKYKGGTVITRGVVEVQSAEGLGATAEGQSAVVLNAAADLHLTVEDSASTEKQLVTKLASVGDDIQGDVRVTGNKNATERVLHMADNGYNAASTTLDEKGTFLLCGTPIDGAGIHSHSAELTGSGTVVVSDATGSGTTATFDSMVDYTGDFRVEGDKAAIQVKTGSFIDGSINVAGQQASVNIGGNVSIAAGESLHLRSTGVVPALAEGGAPSHGTGAALISDGAVSVAAGAVLSVSQSKTDYAYNLNDLKEVTSLTPEDVTLSNAAQVVSEFTPVGSGVPDYREQFNTNVAINQQAAGAVKAAGGLTMTGGASYEANQAHISLMGGSLTFDTLQNNQITYKTTLDVPVGAQVVLFSDVRSVTFGYGDERIVASADSGVYYTRADRYLTGSEYINSDTVLVYDSEAGVVYLQLIPALVPEPATTTLSLLALTSMLARRRRRA